MKGRAYRRGKTWSYLVDLPVGPDGKRRQRGKGGFRTKAEANAALALLLSEVATGHVVDPHKQATGAYLREWLSNASQSLQPNTVAQYTVAVEKWLIPELGHVRLMDLTPATVQAAINGLSARGLSPRSVRVAYGVLNRALRTAVSWRFLPRNPCDADLNLPAKAHTEMLAWDPYEARTFIKYAAGEHDEPLWMLLLSTGLRRGEALGLRWSDVAETHLEVKQALIVVDGKVMLSEPKTKTSRRAVALSPPARAALRRQRLVQEEDREAAGSAWKDSGLVFTNSLGGFLHPSNLRRPFDRACKAAAVRRLRIHDLRHSFATIALDQGVHPKLVQEMLGHTSIEMTLGIYSHTTSELHASAADKIGEAFS